MHIHRTRFSGIYSTWCAWYQIVTVWKVKARSHYEKHSSNWRINWLVFLCIKIFFKRTIYIYKCVWIALLLTSIVSYYIQAKKVLQKSGNTPVSLEESYLNTNTLRRQIKFTMRVLFFLLTTLKSAYLFMS